MKTEPESVYLLIEYITDSRADSILIIRINRPTDLAEPTKSAKIRQLFYEVFRHWVKGILRSAVVFVTCSDFKIACAHLGFPELVILSAVFVFLFPYLN